MMSNRMMKDSGIEWIGEIPAEWETGRTKHVFKAVKRVVGESYGYYERLALTMNGVIKRSKTDNTGLQPEKFDGYQILKPNELVFKLIDLENIKTSRVGISQFKGLVSPAYIVLTNNQKDNTYFYQYFKNMYYQEIFNKLGDDGVRSSLNRNDLLNIPIPLPPLHEQQAIATYLDEQVSRLDQLIEDQQQVIEDWKAYKQSLITETVTKGLNPEVEMKNSGIEWIGEIPSHWEVSKIKYVSNLNEKNLSDKTNPNYCFRYVDIGSVNLIDGISKYENFSFHNAPSRARRVVSKGDVIVSTVRTYLKAIAVIEEDGNVIVSTGFAVITPKKVNRIYLGYFLKSEPFIHNVNANSTGVNYPSITSSKIASMELNIPPLHEQQQVADFLDEKCSKIDQLIEDKQRLIEDLKAYKQSLIYECVTGKKEIV